MRLLLVLLFGFLLTPVYSQVASSVTGPWNEEATWDCTCIPDLNQGAITISAGTTVTLPAAYAVTADQITVQGEATLIIDGTLTLSSSGGTDLLIEEADFATTFADGLVTVSSGGVLENLSVISSNANTLDFESGSEYEHNQNGGTIPTADYLSGSTVRITGITSTAPSGLGQAFHHFIWESAAQSASSMFLNGALADINGDFTISNTNSKFLGLGFSSGTSTGATDVAGNMTLSGKSKLIVSTAATYTLTIGGTFDISADPDNSGNFPMIGTSSGSVLIDVSSNFSFSSSLRTIRLVSAGGSAELEVSGNFSVTNGTFDMSAGAGTGTIDFSGGNFNFTSGTITESSTGSGSITLSRAGVQNFNGGGTFSNTVNFTVNSGATLDIDDSDALAGSGSFTLNGNINVGSTQASGALQTGTGGGNIRVAGTRTYASGSKITYDGTAGQFIGNGHPTASGVTTTIDNASGVSLAADATIGGNLVLTNGNVTVGAYTLTIGAGITSNGNTIAVDATSSLVINGSGALGTFPFPAGDQTLNNFTLNRGSGSVTFANDVTINGTVDLDNGSLIFNGQTLTLDGTFLASSGSLAGNSLSMLNITGSGAFGTLAFGVSGNTVNTFTFDRIDAGTAGIANTLNITTALNLTNGDFTNTSGFLTLDNGATLTRSSSSSLLGENITTATGEFYNVVYTGGSMSTGFELPTALDDDLMDLTINGGPVTLTQDIIVNGDVILQNGSLDGSTFDITMAGSSALWDRQVGTFTPSTSTVVVTGSTTIQGTSARFASLNVDAGATLTANALLNINTNLQLDAGCTFNHSSGIVAFTGSGTQVLAGAGKSFYDLRVNKSAGVLQMSSQVNLINTLDIQTATEVQSNGSLVLISTSDGASGNASVLALPSGASITGNVTSQRYMSSEGRIYRYISSPVSGAAVSALQDDFPVTGTFTGASTGCSGCTTNPSMFYYDETVTGTADNGYLSYPTSANTETLTVGMGYTPFVRQNILAGPVTIDLTGTLNQGTVSLPVTYTNTGDATADGYNLVGNPYPSTIDWDIAAGWTKTNIDNTIAVRDNGSGGVYLYWNGSAGALTNGLIAAGQGFWVQTTGSSPALQVNEQAKTSSTGQFYRMQKTPEEIHVIEMTLTDGRVADKAFFQFSKDSKPGKDIFDARKLNNVGFDFSILSPDGIAMAISASNKIPKEKESIRLRIKDMVKGTFKFSINTSGELAKYEYFLLDRYTNTSIDLQESPVYTFTVTSSPATYAPDRFELFLSRPTGSEQRGDMATAVEVYPNPVEDKMYIKVVSEAMADVVLINRMGKIEERISMVNIDGNAWEGYFDLSAKENGVYFVRVIDLQGRISTQKILKK